MARDVLRSLALAIVLVVACRQITLHGWYAPSPGYRAQVDALLAGRLALTTTPDGLVHDLAWTPTGVHQVWGLGVPLWQAPFEAFGRAIGLSPFPDRVPLVVWLALMLLVVTRAFRPRGPGDAPAGETGWPRPSDTRWTQVGAIVMTALLPALVTVVRGRIGVYEEAAIYAYGAGMILLGGLVALGRAPTTTRYLVLVAFAGSTGLLRPTVWFYGLATALIASALVWRRTGAGRVRVLALGAALFVAGGAALYATNAARFGRGSEFGHRLNIHSLPGNLIATRFSYPFERVGTVEAAEELFTSLFDRPELRSKRGFYQTGLHHGQSAHPRWREYYFTTFSWPYLPAILAGLVLGVLAWRRRGDPLARVLVAWAVLGGAPLLAFFLRSPSVASRYQLDLAPAFVALLVIAWRALAARWPRAGLAAVLGLWLLAVATSKVSRPRTTSDPIDREAAARTAYEISRAVAHDHPLPGAYELADPFIPTWTDALEEYARCADALGARIACDAPALPGDSVVMGERVDRRWWVERTVIPDAPDEATCRPAQDDPVCRAPATVLTDPAAVLERAYLAPPTLYLNGFEWNLATGRVPPATLFYVDDADHLALDVTGPPDTDWEHAVRVAIGLDHLRLVAVAETPSGAQLRFAGGPHPGLQIAFVTFGPDDELDQPRSAFGLRSIRWRDQ